MAKRKGRQEIVSVNILKNSLEYFYKNGEWIKIPDVGMNMGNQSRFVKKRPYDSQYSWEGNRACFEVKLIKEKEFYFSDVKDHQVENLSKALKSGANCYIVINKFVPNEIDRFYFIDIDDFMHWQETSHKNKLTDLDLDYNYHVAFKLDAYSVKIKEKRFKVINLEKTYIV